MNRSKPFFSPQSRPLSPAKLFSVYRVLRRHFGHQRWWPGETPFEVMIGAILTQNTAWTNVEKAIRNLKQANVLSPEALRQLSAPKLAALIRPAGYFNIKATRIHHFVRFYMEKYGGCLDTMKNETTERLRADLLSVNGIGEETADSILLYAVKKKVFVIDAYTKRIFSRHRLRWKVDRSASSISPCELSRRDYLSWQLIFMNSLPHSVSLYNDFHAQIVAVGKNFCSPQKPNCAECPLRRFL